MMTKEERQEYKKEYHEANKDKAKAYYQRPEVKAKAKAYYQRPEAKAKAKAHKKEYYQRPEVKAKVKAYNQRPEVKKRQSERGKNKALISQSRNDYLISLPPEKLLEIVRLKDVDEE